ncbi:MAG: UDP-N-acetylmuramoyl-L-alanine--D-glutamate ligase [Gammaproteobacteria bacterium]|jgi:UDP-N-acetylmuramoylalanine--D-glutamate ligase|nr:UDP-N-acetylmuramoyl-L-alanine--D-glutamate ligase [Gammaproteobacteria bacterium]
MSGIKLILGLGVTGSSCANYFAKKNIKFRIFDTRPASSFDQSISKYDAHILFLQQYDDTIFNKVDEVVISPGFDKNHEIIKKSAFRGIPQLTDIDIFKKDCNKPIISITGTNGKTTIVSMIEHILCRAGLKAIACGNNGIPPLSIRADAYDYIILELSSYQLEYMCDFNSYISLLANIDQDHLERHENMLDYLSIKLKIFKSSKFSILNKSLLETYQSKIEIDDKYLYGVADSNVLVNNKIINEISYDSSKLYVNNSFDLPHRGVHNLENILGVCSVAEILNIDIIGCMKSLISYSHLPHRIELVHSFKNINWYNDSKSTNSASTQVALEYLDNNVILIMGGAKKNINYKPLSSLIDQKVKLLIFIGENKNYINHQLDISTKIINANSMDDAVIIANDHADDGSKILLSPASPSFDMFNNFEERGNAFKQAIDKYVN